ncbi:60S acidic ribosomal protein P0-like [Asparagus officinalis]|uniref:60S acidic ribosomal protein P0-like n=1 Tax=Asparagus officinalis TaxID=4686 RepID=UPI00098DFE12|nr:60S acidic ribosomal protein P0-like [Asparagus officinalis]
MLAIKVTKAEKKQTTPLGSLLDEYKQITIGNAKTVKRNSELRATHSSKWLNIPTKSNDDIAKIITPVELIKKGNKVGPSEAALLTKLGIKPFSYGLTILSVYDNGSVLSPEVLNLTEDDLVDKFAVGVSVVASLSLTLSYPTLAATLHMFVNAYKNVLVVVVISVASVENAAALASKEKEKNDEPVSESDDDLGFSLFD